VAYAKEAITTLPRLAASFCLMGTVLSQLPDGTPEAVKAYTRALALSPDNAVAATHLAGALMSQGKVGEAVAALQAALRARSSAALRLLLGKALATQGKLGEAAEQYHLALSLRPTAEAAAELQTELDRVEQLMREECGPSAGRGEGQFEGDFDDDEEDEEEEEEEEEQEEEQEQDEEEDHGMDEMDEDDGFPEEYEEGHLVGGRGHGHDLSLSHSHGPGGFPSMHGMQTGSERRSPRGHSSSSSAGASGSRVSQSRFAGFHDDDDDDEGEYEEGDDPDRAVGTLYDSDEVHLSPFALRGW